MRFPSPQRFKECVISYRDSKIAWLDRSLLLDLVAFEKVKFRKRETTISWKIFFKLLSIKKLKIQNIMNGEDNSPQFSG